MRCLRALCSSVALWLLAASIPVAASAAEQERGLAETVRQALEANLDLAAQHRALAADREQIALARSNLLPQIDIGARAQLLDAALQMCAALLLLTCIQPAGAVADETKDAKKSDSATSGA